MKIKFSTSRFFLLIIPIWIVDCSFAQCSEARLRAELATATDSIPVRGLQRKPGAAFVFYHNHQQAEEVCGWAVL